MDSHIEFKRKIDNARNILVGAVPSPAGQIDQITYALIYKFMSDIDDKSARLPGGTRQYFVNEYEKYDWHNLMRLDGQAKLNRYRDALVKMRENQYLPEIFRSIYQNASLPYNDPRTLNLFLKEINGFVHTKSDSIGDAYEHLLSITGAQGDVGQFRTPRHIIKFIVDIVQPGKDDTVLDPACGTAGFLIAAYNYVRMQHDGVGEDGEQNGEQRLTADERKKLHGNYYGFDIDPTMVRTATVNMYLHGFSTPNIEIHDTLTREEHWQKRYDVILANPPFMTPKGGIEPHKKFSLSSSRAEILFVDYIISHLKPSGRAGFVVPSSVSINDNAAYYADVRKNLVENGLVAVIELHDSVFKPYAEVTTHIYIVDKTAKAEIKIPFIKIHNDGFDKSDTRKPIGGSELKDAIDYLTHRTADTGRLDVSFIDLKEFWESENYYLSPHLNNRDVLGLEIGVPLVDLIEECKDKVKQQKIEVLSVSNKSGFVISEDYFNKRVASIDISNYKVIKSDYFAYNPSRINVGSIAYNDKYDLGAVSPMYQVFKVKNPDEVDPRYLISILKSQTFLGIINANIKGSTRKVIKLERLKKIRIPLPPIEIQREIVAELEAEQKLIDANKKLIEIYQQKIKAKIAEVWGE